MVNKNRLKVQNEDLRSFENCPIKSELILNKKCYSNIIRSSRKKENSRSKKRRKNSFSFVTRYFFKQSIWNTDWPGYRLFLVFFFPGNFPPDGNPSPITENQAAPMKIFAIFFFLPLPCKIYLHYVFKIREKGRCC